MANSNILMTYVQCNELTPINASLEVLSKAVELGKENGLEVVALLIGKFETTDRKSVV